VVVVGGGAVVGGEVTLVVLLGTVVGARVDAVAWGSVAWGTVVVVPTVVATDVVATDAAAGASAASTACPDAVTTRFRWWSAAADATRTSPTVVTIRICAPSALTITNRFVRPPH
jgi:hypothetical protein